MNVRKRLALTLAAAFLVVFAPGRPSVRAAEPSTVVISQGVDADTLDPLKHTVTPSTNIQHAMYDSLVIHDANGKLIPSLADSFRRVSPTVWEFKLHHNVKFWNGDPLTSEDVKFTVEKIKDPKYLSDQVPRVNTIARVETPDRYTVDYITTKPAALIPGFPWLTMIVDAKYWQEHGDAYMAEHPMGSGPYVFKSWQKDEQVEMDANPAYWGGKPAIEHLVWKPIPEAAARVAALKTGETDLITNVPVQYEQQIVSGANTRMTTARSARVLYIAFNTMSPGPQQNKLLRQAFNYAIDVPAIIKNVLGGHGYATATPIPVGFFGYDAKISGYHHDLAKAKALLAKAGYPDGKGLEMILYSPNGRYNKDAEVSEAIAGQLSALGVHVTVRTQEWTSYILQESQRKLTPMYMLGWGNDSYDADNTLSSLLSSSGRLSTYGNPEVDKLLEAARFEVDSKKREAMYADALEKISDDAPWLFLFQYDDMYATSKRLNWNARGDELIFPKDMKLNG